VSVTEPQASVFTPTLDESANLTVVSACLPVTEPQASVFIPTVDEAANLTDVLGRVPVGEPRVSVVIPTLNEAANLPHVFARLPDDLWELIVVDGSSTDDTVGVAKLLRPDTRIVLETRRGKGAALAAGFAAATGDIIVMLDADGSTDPAEIPRFVAALIAGVDFAKGSRFAEGGSTEDITRLRRIGNRALLGTANVLYRTKYTDLCYGYNAFWRSCQPALDAASGGFEVETRINVRIARAGVKVAEVPSTEYRRIHGVSKLYPVRDGSRVLRTILAERFRREPKRDAVGWEPGPDPGGPVAAA
jgi:glycosyltransferase involved in cell wall biosynthesis